MVSAKKEDQVTQNMINKFIDPDEPVLFSGMIAKLSGMNKSQDRLLVLTGDHIYLFHKEKISRRHRISNIKAFIKSMASNEIVLTIPNAKDIRMTGLSKDRREELKNCLQLMYANRNPTVTLMIYGVPQKDLKQFSRNNMKYNQCALPDDQFRLRKEEIAGTDQMSVIPEIESAAKEDDELLFKMTDEENFENRFTLTHIAENTEESSF